MTAALRPERARAPGQDERRGFGWLALLLLALFLVTQYLWALRVPFINDDFVFLDKTRDASFASLWEPRDLAFHWYRPWSRELHYWSLQKLFGNREVPFHVASWALALAVLGGYFVLVRRLAGLRAAAVAAAAVAALAAWAVPLVWVAGVQELWMLVFSVGFLLAVATGRRALALSLLALALLSKETAAVLPAVAVAHGVLIEGRRPGAALLRTWPQWALVATWAMFHPLLGGRWWRPLAEPPAAGGWDPAGAALRTLAVPLNLHAWPEPENGWGAALALATPGALLLGALVLGAAWWSGGRLEGRAAGGPRGQRAVALFGTTWAVLGWMPLFLPSLGWHSYYALLGALGAWLALGVLLAERPAPAALLVAAVALLRGAHGWTPSRDWGTEWYQRRAAEFLAYMRADLLRVQPDLPSHSRLYFVRVPSNVGFLAGNGPALRVWYGDSTLRGGYYPSYRPRGAAEPRGPDLFFRFDSTAGWVRVRAGPEDVTAARRQNPRWAVDHEVLARTFADADDWAGAAREYEKLARAEPARIEFAYNVGLCREVLGDSGGAALWYARAASLPGADEEARRRAREFAAHLPRGEPAGP